MARLKILLVAAAFGITAGSAHGQTISIGTSPVGTLIHSLGNALGKAMEEDAGLRARVVPFGGGQQYLPLINKKELEMSITGATDILFAYQGKEDFAAQPSPNLRVIGAVFPFYVGFFVKKDSPYKTLADLKGKKVPIGFTASTIQRRFMLTLMAAEGLKESDFDGVAVPHVVRGVDEFMQGKTEAATFAVGGGKVAEANTKVSGVRYLSTTNTPQSNAAVKTVMPTAYVGVLQPAPEFTGIIGPTAVVFEDYLVITGAHLPDDAAYKIAKVLHDSQGKLAGIAKVYARYNKATLSRDHGIPFHPGAIKFYQEKGIWPGKKS
jgi:TRAP transporter TAXI family solute receptor